MKLKQQPCSNRVLSKIQGNERLEHHTHRQTQRSLFAVGRDGKAPQQLHTAAHTHIERDTRILAGLYRHALGTSTPHAQTKITNNTLSCS